MLFVRMQSERDHSKILFEKTLRLRGLRCESAQRELVYKLFRDFPSQFLVDHLFENIEGLRSHHRKTIDKKCGR